ncbi:MAG: DNA-primase RepB domain-containing protein, partial [Candidatus Binataceae bacterium]
MSASIRRIAVQKQLTTILYDGFDVGVLLPSGRMLLREGWSADRVEAALNWFRQQNACGAHIFVRPHGIHELSLLDDLSGDAIAAMKELGFQHALVVETSAGNFQAWLNHGRVLD